jgi:hypothetical protein
MAHRYLKGKRERDYDISADGKSSKLKKPQSFGKMNKDMKSTARALKAIEKAKKTNEEVEELDEISKATMGRYINKAKDSIDTASYRQGHKEAHGSSSKPLEKKLTKRHKGIETAVKKLTKEESEQIDEANGGYHVMGKYTSVSWHPTEDEARTHAKKLNMRGGQHYTVKKGESRRMGEDVEQIDELSKATMGRYINKAATKIGTQGVTAGLKIAKDERSQKNFDTIGKRERGIATAVKKLTREEQDFIDSLNDADMEQIDELSKKTMGSYVKKASGAEQPKNVMSPKNVPLTKIAAYQGDSETGHFGKRFNQATYDKAERLRKNRETGIKRAVGKLTKEEVEITEASVADVAKTAHLHVRAGKHDSIHTAIQSAVNTHFPSSVHSAVTRKKVATQALDRIQSMNKSKMTKEDVEQVDEISKATMGRYINKAKDSIDMTSYRSGIKDGTAISSSTPYKPNNPLEKKLTKRHKGISMAVKKLTKEESENLDELSKATMGRYINKAATKMGSQGVTAGLKIAADEKSSKNFKDMGKREKGISRAVNKLTKEDIDAVKQMNESYKTAFETALSEYGIKSPSELDESKRKEFFNHVDLEFKKGDN